MHDGGSSGSRSRSTDQEMKVMVGKDEVRATVTSSSLTVEQFLKEVRVEGRRALIVGLDCEFYGDIDKALKTALVQISVGKRCLLFQAAIAGTIPDDLKNFLELEGHVFVGAAIVNDMNRLRSDYQVELSKTVELQAMAPFVFPGKWRKVESLATLGQDLLGVKAEGKGTHLRYENWHRPRLTKDQIKYATTDAFMSYKIGYMLHSADGFDLHRSQSPIRAGGGDLLHFVEDEQKLVHRCPACPGGMINN